MNKQNKPTSNVHRIKRPKIEPEMLAIFHEPKGWKYEAVVFLSTLTPNELKAVNTFITILQKQQACKVFQFSERDS